MSFDVLDGDDLDKATVEHVVEDPEREVINQTAAHAALLRDRW